MKFDKLFNIKFEVTLSEWSRNDLEEMLRASRAYEFLTSPGHFVGDWYMTKDGSLYHGREKDPQEKIISIDVADGYNISNIIRLMRGKRFRFTDTKTACPRIISSHVWAADVAGRIEFDHNGPYVSEVRQQWNSAGFDPKKIEEKRKKIEELQSA
ncbi:hypothetical protein COB55_00490 [Candidatus Wolfebacteria bacterium]|nr:MAG: hypothetical protein COB55_00490 [Candidatus Wolfebacteria bacterium]